MKTLSRLGTTTAALAGTMSATCVLGVLLSAVATAQGPGGMLGGGNKPFSNITRRP
jgi:hypothetical protein